jgi:polyhydroxybutyrate depolymerase
MALLGCPPGAGTVRRELVSGEYERSYLLHVPAGPHDAPLPLVIALHPFASNAARFERDTRLSAVADEQGFIVAYPNAFAGAWNDGSLSRREQDDVRFIDELIEAIAMEAPVDDRRVYVTGFSNGGFLAYRLAFDLPGRFAATAAVGANMPAWLAGEPAPPPMPLMYFHGTEDGIVPFEGGVVQPAPGVRFDLLSASETVDYWVAANGAGAVPEVEALPDAAPDDGTRVVRERYAAGDAGAPVVFHRVECGGHTWPGGRDAFGIIVGRTSEDIDASRVIWDFFAGFALPARAGTK